LFNCKLFRGNKSHVCLLPRKFIDHKAEEIFAIALTSLAYAKLRICDFYMLIAAKPFIDLIFYE